MHGKIRTTWACCDIHRVYCITRIYVCPRLLDRIILARDIIIVTVTIEETGKIAFAIRYSRFLRQEYYCNWVPYAQQVVAQHAVVLLVQQIFRQYHDWII